MNNFNCACQTPRLCPEIIQLPTEPLSQFSDLIFADTRVFPEPTLRWLQTHQDLLELNHIYPEYLPYLGLRLDFYSPSQIPSPQLSDPMILQILSLCQDQLLPQAPADLADLADLTDPADPADSDSSSPDSSSPVYDLIIEV